MLIGCERRGGGSGKEQPRWRRGRQFNEAGTATSADSDVHVGIGGQMAPRDRHGWGGCLAVDWDMQVWTPPYLHPTSPGELFAQLYGHG